MQATTGIYYKCLRGDSENLAVGEPDSFAMEDANGRNWICFPVSREDVDTLSLLDHLADVVQADASLRKHGLNETGTEVRIYYCHHLHELHHKLAAELNQS